MIKYLFPDKAPSPGPYTPAVCVEYPELCRLVFLAGQTGNVPGVEGEPVINGGLGPQVTQTLANIVSVVEYAGGDIRHIVELKIFLKDSEAPDKKDRQRERAAARKVCNEAYLGFFEMYGRTKKAGNLPARTMLWAPEVPLEFPTEDTLVEITAIAAIPRR